MCSWAVVAGAVWQLLCVPSAPVGQVGQGRGPRGDLPFPTKMHHRKGCCFLRHKLPSSTTTLPPAHFLHTSHFPTSPLDTTSPPVPCFTAELPIYNEVLMLRWLALAAVAACTPLPASEAVVPAHAFRCSTVGSYVSRCLNDEVICYLRASEGIWCWPLGTKDDSDDRGAL